ncbi:MAG: response regulator transcription factor [Elusimicrobia bacterium]|nr:response regulator transcription factor [Elusimicrobiota bacterium]
MPARALLIEDDPAFRRTVADLLRLHDFEVDEAGSGKAGAAKALAERPDLIVLDLVMPGMNGLEVCQLLKQDPQTASIPILILTGNDREGQDVACLDLGADDYLTKPVKGERLLAYCRALLRRSHPESAASAAVRAGDLVLDYGRKLVSLKGKEYGHLTPKEFGLLYELAGRSPEPEDRTALYQKVWGMDPPSEGSLKTVDVHVRRIRLKLGWRSDRWLVAVHGRGYCIRPPAA